MNNIELLHKHFDECKQCRENPFDLCRMGQKFYGASNSTFVKSLDADILERLDKIIALLEKIARRIP